jgi:electron transfer flavoprotein beta subunit
VKVGVCIKSTPDTDTRVKIAGGGEGIDPAGIKWIISPYDSFALEQGAQTKEKLGGECVLFTVGSGGDVNKNLRDGLSVGADRAVQIDDPALKGTDSLGVARALAAAIKAEGIEIVFCGKQAIDDDNVQVPAMLAELLDWPQVSMANEFAIDGDTWTAVRAVGGGAREKISGKLPVVVTAERGLNAPRYAKLPDIMKGKTKKLDVKKLADLGLSAADVAPAVAVSAFTLPAGRTKGKMIAGDAATQVKELVRLLREEAKVL